MSAVSRQLDPGTSFARGYLLASHWAGVAPSAGSDGRLPALAGKDLDKEYEAIGLLPADRRSALGSVWLGMERPLRIDDAIDPHWSWIAAAIEPERPAFVLQILGALKPDVAKEVLRFMWSKLRSARPEELEIGKPPPPLAAHLRRHLFSSFAFVAERPRGEGDLASLLFLGRRELYLLVQDVGLREIALAGSSGAREEILRSLESLKGVEVARISRLLTKEPVSGSEEGEDPASELAVKLVRRAVDESGGEGDLVGLVGIGKIAIVLAGEPSSFSRQLAQRMRRDVGSKLIERRDEWASREPGDEDRETIAADLMERVRQVLSRGAPLAKADEA